MGVRLTKLARLHAACQASDAKGYTGTSTTSQHTGRQAFHLTAWAAQAVPVQDDVLEQRRQGDDGSDDDMPGGELASPPEGDQRSYDDDGHASNDDNETELGRHGYSL